VKVSESSSEERLQILETFIELVSERGYEDTSVAAVAERAGVDEAAFGRHFSDREDCFVAAWEKLSELYMREVFAVYQSEDSWREQMRALGLALVRYLAEHPTYARVLAIRPPGPRVWAILDRNLEAFIELVDLGRQEMDDPDSLTRATAEGIAWAVHEQLTSHSTRGEPEVLPTLVGPVMYMVVRPYLGDEVALEELERG
jgi:AcrR family transcriptional regulator